mgnify:CR=1 FL=1
MVAALGVDQRRLFTGVFVLGSFLAGLGGALQVPRLALTTVMDTTVIVEAFVVVVIGGMGSVWGALLGLAPDRRPQRLRCPRPAQGLHRPHVRRDGRGAHRAAVGTARPSGDPAARGRRSGRRDGRDVPWHPAWLAALGWSSWRCLSPLPTFWIWMAVEIFAFALFAASLHLLMGLGGMVSFGHAAYFRPRRLRRGAPAQAGGLADAAGLPRRAAWSPPSPPPLFGYFSVRLTSIYFAMLTLAFAQIVFAVVHQWDDVTGGDNGVLSVWPPSVAQVPDALLLLGARLRRRGRRACSG